MKTQIQWPKPLGPLSVLLLTSHVTLSIICLNIYCFRNGLYSKHFWIKSFTCSSFCSRFSCQQTQDSGSRKGVFCAGLLVWNGCSIASVLCVTAEKLLEVLTKCSVLGKVSGPDMKYMEGKEISSPCLRAWMLLLPEQNYTFEKRCSANRGASCQPTDLHVCVSARVNHAYSIILFFFSSHGQQICS